MKEPSKRQNSAARHEAIDVSDFVYAATGARVRRLTMPDGSHWFPAVDVCKELGHTNSRKALADHVPDEHREMLETVTGGYGLGVPAGRGWRRDLHIISLQGLILLVNACTKPACAPFKQWVAEVIETVQREGSYSLDEAEVQPAEAGAPIAYAMPDQVAEAIVRLEAHNLRLDEELAEGQRTSIALQREMLTTQQATLATQQAGLAAQQATLAVQQAMVRALERIADRFDTLVLPRGTAVGHPAPAPTTESVLADWRQRLSVTEDVWTVALVIAPVLVATGELREPLESIAARTGLSVRRVNECLRLLRRHACIRSRGGSEDGAPVYVLHHA
ncbi:Bro-N domain-containing protein [Streptomyces olivaceus]|uniref:Bro-N domain-containing protein n=1 Tax=Streptomyces olivaceus TaxID=47716 RepID=A0ABS7W1D4_STROV|nr:MULTISPECIES: Bro-N domain-containing protein [Streptomyces]MBZ6082576.1 Bro-N domain-containing protein [Streptomyces olivaceus]MBZ6088674.1 Bro-N domain-containing protein [Streptomyces olivaceus]MBZ6095952.1 Bro-N domain-containing protein [Streptomyces olivaceus]MBZ6104398.1 Bro-N domain-containing protein [Streptomyces olivaceus]MBZ6116814.1 Bro-N domain-containing protein [Streptomyces olivaceus]